MDLGLECYVSKHNGFCGQIKRSYEDFQVVEIDENGFEVRLIDNIESVSVSLHVADDENKLEKEAIAFEMPSDETTVQKYEKKDKKTAFYQPESFMDSVKIKEAENKLTDVLGQSMMCKLSQLSHTLQANANNGCFSLGSFNDKTVRTSIHLYTRMVFPAVQTTTIQESGQYTMTARIDPVFTDFTTLISEIKDIENLMRFCHCLDKSSSASYNLSCNDNKECRTKIHRLLAKNFGSFLESKTFPASKDNNGYIQVRMRTKKKSKGTKRNDKSILGKGSRSNLYTEFVLRKENMETLEAIESLCKTVGVYPSEFSYAGTKDKKAITIQNMTVRGVLPHRLHKVNSDALLQNIKIGSYKMVKQPLKMGDLTGNVFKIVIRDIHQKGVPSNWSSHALHNEIMESLKNTAAHGFINYFGSQRFGHEEGVTTRGDTIGLAMLQGNMIKAVNLILMPESDKNDEANAAKRYYQETGDISGTLSRMPNSKIRERLILKSLHRHGRDQDGCTKALFSIPYSMRLMYAHSFTSLVWNKMASKRLQDYTDLGIVAGDLVCDYTANEDSKGLDLRGSIKSVKGLILGKKDLSEVADVTLSQHFNKPSAECNVNDEILKRASGTIQQEHLAKDENEITQETGGVNVENKVGSINHENDHWGVDKSRVRIATVDDVQDKKFTIRDLVLPIPGYNVLYPTNTIGERYRETLELSGLTDKHFRLRSLGLSLPGGYRRVIAVPRDLRYKWIVDNSVSTAATCSVANSGSCQLDAKTQLLSSKTHQAYTGMKRELQNISLVDTENDKESQLCEDLTKPAKRAKHDNETKGAEIPLTNDVELCFKLDSSCYATMCLREMMKS